jgi:hypothetical protein
MTSPLLIGKPAYPLCLLDCSWFLDAETAAALSAYRSVKTEKEAWEMWGALQRSAQLASPEVGQAILLMLNAIGREVNLRFGLSQKRGRLGDSGRISQVLNLVALDKTLSEISSDITSIRTERAA